MRRTRRWFIRNSMLAGQALGPAIGHAGGGTSFAWADPDNQLAVAFLCNRMKGSASWESYTRLGDAVYSSFKGGVI